MWRITWNSIPRYAGTMKHHFWSGVENILGQMLLLGEDHVCSVRSSLNLVVVEDNTIISDSQRTINTSTIKIYIISSPCFITQIITEKCTLCKWAPFCLATFWSTEYLLFAALFSWDSCWSTLWLYLTKCIHSEHPATWVMH